MIMTRTSIDIPLQMWPWPAADEPSKATPTEEPAHCVLLRYYFACLASTVYCLTPSANDESPLPLVVSINLATKRCQQTDCYY